MPLSPTLVALAAPAALVLFASASLASSGLRPRIRLAIPLLSAAMLLSAAGVWAVLATDGATSAALGPFFVRIDLVSVILYTLIVVIGSVVLGFSRTYLDGEARQGAFLGWMALTLAAALLLVSAGGLWQLAAAWVGVNLFMRQLLLFYAKRPGARRAARKEFLFARLSDLALAGAVAALWLQSGTSDIAAINAAAQDWGGSPWSLTAAILLGVAAALKSAQFPAHGWLTEVMETPTPVSALLHAGVINAGGFLLIRFADVMVAEPGVLAGLAMLGGFTALFGGLVMLTQPAVKTSLAWSTVGQMGFMMLQCGLALFPLALLHIVAHSLYKAHSFLSAGGAVAQVASIRRPGPIAVPKLGAVGAAFGAALAVYVVVGFLVGFDGKSPQVIALGGIMVLGVAYLLAQGFADQAPRALTLYTSAYAGAATFGYFLLQTGAETLLVDTLPATPAPGPLEWALIVLALLSFGFTAIAQATFPLWSSHPAVRGLRVHLANGFYINALTDRWLAAWSRSIG